MIYSICVLLLGVTLTKCQTDIFYSQLTTGEVLGDNDVIMVVETPYNDATCDQFPADQVGVSFGRGEAVTEWHSMTFNPMDDMRDQNIMWRMDSDGNTSPHLVYLFHESLYPNRLCFWFEDSGIGNQRTCKYVLSDGFTALKPQTLYTFTWSSE